MPQPPTAVGFWAELGNMKVFKNTEQMIFQGAVFDSSPGPIGIQNIQKVIKVRAINKFHPRGQTSLFLPFHLYGVNMANRVPVGQTLCEVWDQIRY